METQIQTDRQKAFERAEGDLLGMPQVACPLSHYFAPGVYIREVVMPAGTFVIGHQHKTEHFNLCLSGKARVMMDDGEVLTVTAPAILKSGTGVRKAFLVLEEMRWATVHPTDETNINRLEEDLIIKSGTYLEHELDVLEQLKNHQEEP